MTKAEKNLYGVTYTNGATIGGEAVYATWDCRALNECDALGQFYTAYGLSNDFTIFGMPMVQAVAKV